MGVAKTLPNYKSFTFDGTNSRNYGVYITGQGVFNAPERNVEMVEIPGRNGAYALDKGNFNNIEVTYPAGIFADTEADFAQAVSDLRNFLCSKSGYCRLEDDYNSGEYRMAIYKSGLEVTHEMLIAGEFNIVFECKPQRYLTSGETKVNVTAFPHVVTNPTPFASHPMIEFTGSGGVQFFTTDATLIGSIDVENRTLGNVILKNASYMQTDTFIQIDDAIGTVVATNDTISCPYVEFRLLLKPNAGQSAMASATISITNKLPGTADASAEIVGLDTYLTIRCSINDLSFICGTDGSYVITTSLSITDGNGITHTYTPIFRFSYSATGANAGCIKGKTEITTDAYLTSMAYSVWTDTITADSSVSVLGNPMYIDLDTGECYKIENGIAISTNDAVTISTELPTFPSGESLIVSNGFQFGKFEYIPRWWKV